jgi:segregation and condensation protein A
MSDEELRQPSTTTDQDAWRFQLEEFEGPMDLLLFLIRKNEINIYDIPIARITEQYLAYIKYNTRQDLEHITDFYVMAATLLYIKSRMLLPVEINLDDELEDPRKELVERLIEYQKFRKLSELMAEKERESEWYIERRKIQTALPFAAEDNQWEQIEVWDLLKTFSHIMTNLTPERIINLYEEVSLNEKISLIQEFLDTRGEFFFTDLIIKPDSIMEIICSFLAILESVKMKRIRILQNRLFGDIRIVAWIGPGSTETDIVTSNTTTSESFV